MKKVKIMLMSALVIAAVGGALAFKAQKSANLFCGPTFNNCPIQQDPRALTYDNADINNRVTDVVCTDQEDGDCTYVTLEAGK